MVIFDFLKIKQSVSKVCTCVFFWRGAVSVTLTGFLVRFLL